MELKCEECGYEPQEFETEAIKSCAVMKKCPDCMTEADQKEYQTRLDTMARLREAQPETDAVKKYLGILRAWHALYDEKQAVVVWSEAVGEQISVGFLITLSQPEDLTAAREHFPADIDGHPIYYTVAQPHPKRLHPVEETQTDDDVDGE